MSASLTIVARMRPQPIARPADPDRVRASYDRAADNYVEMVTTTGIGDIRIHPWLEAAIDALASTVAAVVRYSTSAADRGPLRPIPPSKC